MPSSLLLDLSTIDLNRIVVGREQIYNVLPHRHEFMLADGIVHIDRTARIAVAFRDIREDEWWVRGHIPGRPLFPGVLMVETAAQLASFLSKEIQEVSGFIGFSGIDGVKFRSPVSPPARMYFILKAVNVRPRRIVCEAQGIVDGQLVFEGQVTGMPI
jgi:3-hydroxyacyl-[acyl-carrier-protein] dehydratase